MARIVYSKRSIQDLAEAGDYIAESLKNPMAALNTISRIQDAIDKLADFPRMGTPLPAAADVLDYRFLVCGNYLAFYRVQEEIVYIDRIMYGRRDYLALLFSNLPLDEEK